MSRGISATYQTELAKAQVTTCMLVKLEFDSGDVTFWTGAHTLTWSGDDYLAAGNLVNISKIKEDISGSAQGCAVQISGIPSTSLSLALTEDYHGRAGTIRWGLLNTSTLGLIADPHIFFQGFMDIAQITGTGQTRVITISLEHEAIRQKQPSVLLYTHAEQLSRFSDDDAFKFIARQTQESEYWGNVAPV